MNRKRTFALEFGRIVVNIRESKICGETELIVSIHAITDNDV